MVGICSRRHWLKVMPRRRLVRWLSGRDLEALDIMMSLFLVRESIRCTYYTTRPVDTHNPRTYVTRYGGYAQKKPPVRKTPGGL